MDILTVRIKIIIFQVLPNKLFINIKMIFSIKWPSFRVCLKFIIFLKRLGFINRIIGVGALSFIMFFVVIPDVSYLISQDKEEKLSLETLASLNEGSIPKYFTVSDELVPSGHYVEERTEDDGELKGIVYPVFPQSDTAFVDVKLLIEDRKVNDAELEDESYFISLGTTFRGGHDGSYVDSETRGILEEMGYQLADNVIILKKDQKPGKLSNNLIAVVVLTLLILAGLASFIPTKYLEGSSDAV